MAAILDFRVKMAKIWQINPWNGFLTTVLVKTYTSIVLSKIFLRKPNLANPKWPPAAILDFGLS